MHPKEFLEHECENVSLALKETLRYDYGHGRSSEFYDECSVRLESIKGKLSKISASNLDELDILASELSRLSRLISLIERSHIGEFSWPFAEALRKLAVEVSRDSSPIPTLEDPSFFMSSDGGLTAYRIYPEQEPVSFLRMKRKIFTIVFPRTLKEQVLLHTILGHEIGHAAWTSPSTQKDLIEAVIAPLIRTGPMQDSEGLRRWLKRHYGASLSPTQAAEVWTSWFEEILCDLFGMATFGPSFLPAHKTLLSTLDPQGLNLGDEHPPNASRFDLMSKAFEHTGWSNSKPFDTASARSCWREFSRKCKELPSPTPRYAVLFQVSQIEEAVDGIVGVLRRLGTAHYGSIDHTAVTDILEKLRRWLPPIASGVSADGRVFLEEYDFRDILLGGWVAWYGRDHLWPSRDGLTFVSINKLCDKAILQQQGISIWKEPRDG